MATTLSGIPPSGLFNWGHWRKTRRLPSVRGKLTAEPDANYIRSARSANGTRIQRAHDFWPDLPLHWRRTANQRHVDVGFLKRGSPNLQADPATLWTTEEVHYINCQTIPGSSQD